MAAVPSDDGQGGEHGPDSVGAADSRASAEAWLLTVMKKESNRVMLAQLENALVAFMKDSSARSLPLPPKGAYFRKVCCAVAQRFRLDYRSEPIEVALPPSSASSSAPLPGLCVSKHPSSNPTPANRTSEVSMRLVLLKTANSAVPEMRLADLAPRETTVSRSKPGENSHGTVLKRDLKVNAREMDPEKAPVPRQNSLSSERSPFGVSGGQGTGPTGLSFDASVGGTHTPKVWGDAPVRDAPLQPWGMEGTAHVPDPEARKRPATVLRRPVSEGKGGVLRAGGVACKLSGQGSSSSGAVKNVTEEEYQTARARIFMGSSASCERVGSDLGTTLERLSLNTGSSAGVPAAGRVARGPVEGSIGFNRGRGKQVQAASSGHPADVGTPGGADSASAADSRDPDFDRRYSRWQPPSAPPRVPVSPFYNPHAAHPHPFHVPQTHSSIIGHSHEQSYQPLIRQPIPHPVHSVINHNRIVPGYQVQTSLPNTGRGGDTSAPQGLYSFSAAPQAQSFGVQGPPPLDEARRVAAMFLPSHTPQHGQSWEAPPIEPHVARSSGVLRPSGELGGASEVPLKSQASYGLDSLADFPSLTDQAKPQNLS